jgi:hypothetical protein
MIGKKQCLRCKDVDLIRKGYRAHSSVLSIPTGFISWVNIQLYVCPDCGYVELGIGSKDELQTVLDKAESL